MPRLVDRPKPAKVKITEEAALAEARRIAAAEWKARHGGKEVAEVVCSPERYPECRITVLHVHPRRAPERWELVDRAGRWTDTPVGAL